MTERAKPRNTCPDCGCNCPVCRYRHRSPDALLSHAIRCDSTERTPTFSREATP